MTSRQGYTTNLWFGYGQAQKLGGHVKKGEKGTHGIIYKPLMVDDDETEDGKRTIPMLKTFVVFNLDQVEGLEHLRPELPDAGSVFGPIQVAEEILVKSGARIVEGGTRAYYRQSEDKIGLPERFRFQTAESFYTTALHELTHWTGHESRLDRTWGKRFGDQAYAFEELVAEMGSAFLTAKLGLQGELQTCQLHYRLAPGAEAGRARLDSGGQPGPEGVRVHPCAGRGTKGGGHGGRGQRQLEAEEVSAASAQGWGLQSVEGGR